MKSFFLPSLALTLLAAPFMRAPAAAEPQDPGALVKRMAQANPMLQSYTATLHVMIALRSMPLQTGLDANYYYKRPDKQAVIFQSVPILAQQFAKVYPKIDPPATWPGLYDVTVSSQSESTTTLRLVPKRQGRVDHVEVVVNDSTAMPASFTWIYKDGGSVSLQEHYAVVDGNYLVNAQNGRVDLPSYNADVTSTFSDFKINVPIPDSVFSG